MKPRLVGQLLVEPRPSVEPSNSQPKADPGSFENALKSATATVSALTEALTSWLVLLRHTSTAVFELTGFTKIGGPLTKQIGLSAIISLTKGSLDVVSEPDRLARDTDAEDAIEITPEMISVGVAALKAYDPEREEPEALVFAILYRAFTIAVRNAKAAMAPLAE